ncbi:SRPBCC domain-containing protein [Demequina sp. NBRC 110055]|uniref:SRPBCC domain-containing protein n=1 Tax=Demequina sp. NBRC 110055 TaxID=1570344 RepID=UPI000A002FC2|nr:SRPBCC domain-containing protein [Demequina sp. NBRC 110055]
MTERPTDAAIVAAIRAHTEVLLEHEAGRWTLVMRRHFTQEADLLWRMLTEPDRLACWSPVVPDRPLTTPGPATSRENPDDDPVDTEVLSADAPHSLVHRWRDDVLRWTITPDATGAVLELRHRIADRTDSPVYAAGWHVCLARLAAEDGAARERPTGQRSLAYGWEGLRDRYRDELAD